MLIILRNEDKPKTDFIIDNIVSAEIPNIITSPRLHEVVLNLMVHRPCGPDNPNSSCMNGDKCSKDFPKSFKKSTEHSTSGYPLYQRDSGFIANINGNNIDDRWIVPYNPYLLLKYNCHINVEVCTSMKAVKYLFKYIYKGHDCANIAFNINSNDEINSYLDSR